MLILLILFMAFFRWIGKTETKNFALSREKNHVSEYR